MIYELVYTSRPRGVKSGTSGFTSVGYTEEMPERYISLCESLSGYTALFPLGHVHYKNNPIRYSHYRFQMDGKWVSVLSRVTPSGTDYSGRENILAHHIVLEQDQIDRQGCRQGPARLMLNRDLFFEKWDADPQLLPKNRIREKLKIFSNESEISYPNSPSPFMERGLEGEVSAQVARHFAQRALERPHIPSFIRFNPTRSLFPPPESIPQTSFSSSFPFPKDHETDRDALHAESISSQICLTLISEAQSYIPPEKRWNITFSTYFTTKPMDSDCLWRCCAIDSKGDAAIANYPDALVVDLENQTVSGNVSINAFQDNLIDLWQKDDRKELTGSEREKRDVSNIKIEESAKIDTQNDADESVEFKVQTDAESLKRTVGKKSSLFWAGIALSMLLIGFIFMMMNKIQHHENLEKKKEFKNSTPVRKELTKAGNESVASSIDKMEKMEINQPINAGSNAVERVDKEETPLTKRKETENGKSTEKHEIDLYFYGNDDRITIKLNRGEKTDFGALECLVMTTLGDEFPVRIEEPVTMDTRNWDMVYETAMGKFQRVGYLSSHNVHRKTILKLSLYRPDNYSALYFDDPYNSKGRIIWSAPVRLDRSALVWKKERLPVDNPVSSEASDVELQQSFVWANRFQIIIGPEHSTLFPLFLSLWKNKAVTGTIEYRHGDQWNIPDGLPLSGIITNHEKQEDSIESQDQYIFDLEVLHVPEHAKPGDEDGVDQGEDHHYLYSFDRIAITSPHQGKEIPLIIVQ